MVIGAIKVFISILDVFDELTKLDPRTGRREGGWGCPFSKQLMLIIILLFNINSHLSIMNIISEFEC